MNNHPKPIKFNDQRQLFSLFIKTAFFLFLLTTAQAAPGDLDATFGNGGQVVTDIQMGRVGQLLVQNDGKTLVVGTTNGLSAVMARFNPNGQSDSSFGTGGRLVTNIARTFEDAAIQNDGKIVVVGYTAAGRLIAVRYNSDATLDTNFGNGGSFIQQPGTGVSGATEGYAIDIQSDGKILVSGRYFIAKIGGGLLYRLNADGSLDTSFGNNGNYQFSGLNGTNISDIVALPDGKILVLSGSVRRLNANGTLDTTFGSGGFQSSGFFIAKLAVQADGKIIAVGYSFTGNNFVVQRFNPNGGLDSTFGNSGVSEIQIGSGTSGAEDLAIQKNGKIVVTGYSQVGGNRQFTTVRYKSNGTLDPDFGNNGVVVMPISSQQAYSNTIALQPDGKIVVAGNASNNNSLGLLTLVRYLGDAVNSAPRFDFDGDSRADVAVFRPSSSIWYLLNSSNGFGAVPFGLSQDQIAPADFDGDRKTDIAVFRATIGEWTVLNSSNNTYRVLNFGTAGDLARPGDFDGDGRADIALFRPSNGFWYWLNSSDNHFRFAQFGQNGDAPLIADFDDDGKSDLAVYRPANGVWFWRRSSDSVVQGLAFGAGEDVAVPADFDGDGKTDIAVWRPSNGIWYVRRSLLGLTGVQFGQATDRPVPADYDGDGRADVAVFRPSNGIWYISASATGGFNAVQFGSGGDKPIPSAFTP